MLARGEHIGRFCILHGYGFDNEVLDLMVTNLDEHEEASSRHNAWIKGRAIGSSRVWMFWGEMSGKLWMSLRSIFGIS